MMSVELRCVGFSVTMVGLIGVAACDQETPTSVGDSLLPGPLVQTFEVILEPSEYLVSDTSFSGYVEPAQSGAVYQILARDFEGVLNARALVEFNSIPETITVVDSLEVQHTDSLPQFIGGELVIVVDTFQTSPPPVTVEVYRARQSWDVSSANWTTRVDTGGEPLRWNTVGGAPGALAGAGTWTGSPVRFADSPKVADTLRIPIDSATIAAWRDTLNVPGAVIIPAAGSRLRTSAGGLELRVDTRSSIVDTVVTATVAPLNQTFIFDSPLPSEVSEIRVGGAPSWRAFLQFRERLDTLTVPCPPDFGPPGCRLPLSETSISYAALLLDPLAPPDGFGLEGHLQLGASLLLADSAIAIERAPLGSAVGLMPEALPATRFSDPNDEPVQLMITSFISALTRDSARVDEEERPSPNLAVFEATGVVGSGGQIGSFTSTEGLMFGFATFASRPRLRLLLTVSGELGLR